MQFQIQLAHCSCQKKIKGYPGHHTFINMFRVLLYISAIKFSLRHH